MNELRTKYRTSRTFPRGRHSRRGVYVLELVLILPIILLVLMILYQVSVMMTTYQALRTTAFNAAFAFSGAAATADTTNNVQNNAQNAISESIASYYFGHPAAFTCAVSENAWNMTPGSTAYVVKYRLLTSADGTNWTYYNPVDAASGAIESGTHIAVELKLENADDAFPGYWILSRFVGVQAAKSEQMVLSQVTVKE